MKQFNLYKKLGLYQQLTLMLVLALPMQGFAYEEEINKLSAKMAIKIAEQKKKKLAVVDFTDLQGNVTELGRFISEEMSVSLADSAKGFRIIDRTHLKAIIKEHKLSASGIINPETARKLGKISGVDALITGTLTPFGEKVRISVKVLDTTTADIISSVRGNIAKTKGIEELLSRDISTAIMSTSQSSVTKKMAQRKNLQGNTDLVKEVSGIEFRLKQCKATGSSLKCHLIVQNLQKDQALAIYGSLNNRSRIINEFGDEFFSNGAQLGSSADVVKTKHVMMPEKIPLKASINYKIDVKTKLMSILEILIYVGSEKKVQFRNVAVER